MILCFLWQGLTFEARDYWPISEAFIVSHSSLCVVPCSPNHINEADGALFQEENIDNLCNEAFDELLT